MVNLGRVCVEGTLTCNLLAGVEDKGEQETLANGAILPESSVARRNGLLLEFESLANGQNLVLDFLLGLTDATE